MRVREFELINERGQKFSFMDLKNGCFLTSPSGLGYSYSNSYEQLGNIFIETLSKLEKGRITGTANFRSYDNYTKLVNFIETSNELKFVYKIPYKDEVKEYLKDVKFQLIGKTERKTNGLISENITFDCLSLWYQDRETVYTIAKLTEEMQWDFVWGIRFADYSSRSITFINDGHIEAPFILEMDNYIINPSFSISQNGEVINELKIPTTIQKGEKLLYSSKDNELYILKQKVDGSIENLFINQYIDLNKNNIFRIPKGVSEITLSADNDILDAKLNIFKQYKGV